MHNNNERGVFISINDQHTNCNNSDKGNLENNNLEYTIHQMAISQDQKGQLEISGFGNGDFSNNKDSQKIIPELSNYSNNFINNTYYEGQILGSENAMMNGICYNLEKNTKLNPDDLLDEINLSDEDQLCNSGKIMAEKEYNNQMDKINEYYDDMGDGSMNKYTGTKNEVEERNEIPIPFEIDSNTLFLVAGIVESIFENDKILLKPNLQIGILDLDNIIWNSNHIAVGYLDDVIGKIDEPVYVLRFFPNLVDKNLVKQGEPLYFVKDKAHKIEKKELLKKKGCDASNAFDEEVSDSGKEFSDDEQEYYYKQMKRKNRNNFAKRKIEESRGEFIIQSEPVRKGIDNLKSKYFTEKSYVDSYSKNDKYLNDDFNIPVKKPNIQKNESIPQSFYTSQHVIGAPQNPYFSAEYKINNNVNTNNINNNSYNNNFSNMMSFGNYNSVGANNKPGMNNVTNLLRPMAINPFAPPTMANNPNFNFNLGNGSTNNNIFHNSHNIFNNKNFSNENNQNN